MKIESWVAEDVKRRWKVVRRDTFVDVPGEIIMADEESGECTLKVKPPGAPDYETRTMSFGYKGLAIVRRGS